jgi:putative heme degradation protein
MTQNPAPKLVEINAQPDDVLLRLPELGSLMMIGKARGATHERIGGVADVTRQAERLACKGPFHDSLLDYGQVHNIQLNTARLIQGKAYPRMEFHDAAGETLFAVVGFEGAEIFEERLSHFPCVELGPAEAPPFPKRPDVAEDDIGCLPLKAVLASQQPISIVFETNAFRQSWTGVVERVSPGMGFINVTRDDFHLHLLGGTVASWIEDQEDGESILVALDHHGAQAGLTLRAATPSAWVGWNEGLR